MSSIRMMAAVQQGPTATLTSRQRLIAPAGGAGAHGSKGGDGAAGDEQEVAEADCGALRGLHGAVDGAVVAGLGGGREVGVARPLVVLHLLQPPHRRQAARLPQPTTKRTNMRQSAKSGRSGMTLSKDSVPIRQRPTRAKASYRASRRNSLGG